jgi:hypothetical protein
MIFVFAGSAPLQRRIMFLVQNRMSGTGVPRSRQ